MSPFESQGVVVRRDLSAAGDLSAHVQREMTEPLEGLAVEKLWLEAASGQPRVDELTGDPGQPLAAGAGEGPLLGEARDPRRLG